MSYQNTNVIDQQSIGQERAHFSPTHPDQTDSFSATFEQRKYLHEAHNLEQRNLWNSSSSSYFHSRHGEPLYRSLLRSHYHAHPSCLDYVEGAHHLHHEQCLCETDNSAAGDCFSQQCVHYNPCRCGSPMLHETNTSMGLLSKGHGYHPNRALPNEITLYDWCLIRSCGPHSPDVAVGGFLSSRGTEVERIETETIVKRLTERKLLTKDGNVINLAGPIDDYSTVSNGFTLQTVHLFRSGFPHIWKIVVGMGLPAKVTGTNTPLRRCSFPGGEINFQERLDTEARSQRECMQPFSVLEGLETDLVSSLEGERNCSAKHVTEDSICVKAGKKILDSATMLEQGMSLLNAECQSKEDQLLLHDQAQQRALHKSEEREGMCTEECSQHKGFHCQIKSTANELVEVMDLTSEQEHMHIEGVDAPVSDIVNKESEFNTHITTENDTMEENLISQAFFETTPDAHAEQEKLSGEDLESASVHSFQMSEGELQMAQSCITARRTSSKRRKVAFGSENHVEGGDPSNVGSSLETSTKGMETSCNLLNKEQAECKSSVVFIETRKGVVDKKVTAKKKVKRKRRGGLLLFKSKRSNQSMVDFKRRANSVEKQRDFFQKQELDREVSKNESRKLMEVQAAFVEQDLSTDKTAEVVSDSVLVTRMKTRQGMKTSEGPIKSLVVKKCMQTKSITKDRDDSAKLKDTSNQAVVQNLEDHDSLPSGNSLRKEKRRRSKGSVLDPQPDTLEQKEANKLEDHNSLRKERMRRSKGSVLDPPQDISDQKEDDKLEDHDSLPLGNCLRKEKRRRSKGSVLDPQLDTTEQKEANKLEDHDSLPSGNSLREEKRRRSEGSVLDPQQDIPDQKEDNKPSENLETLGMEDLSSVLENSKQNCSGQSHNGSDPSATSSTRKRIKQMLPPPLPSPLVAVPKQLVSKAFGLKTSKSGRLLVPPLAHWRGQSLVRDMDGGIIGIEGGSQGTPRETGCFNFKLPMEARAKKLQEWLSVTASKCRTKKMNARQKSRQSKTAPK